MMIVNQNKIPDTTWSLYVGEYWIYTNYILWVYIGPSSLIIIFLVYMITISEQWKHNLHQSIGLKLVN